ncbi:MAG: redox-sensing transcriptional repressor Rex [Kiritimatiellae bacterium]|nr:redox-sensing transcriptional repressor Rex [Kiritimatiellia bacterium]
MCAMQLVIPKEAIERLSKYRSVLLRLKALGFVKVFSDNLADAQGLSASQVRKDFALYGMRGMKRGGYLIDDLVERLTAVLGVSGLLKTVVIGCGHIGSALLRTYGGRRQGVSVVAAFDVNPQKLNPSADVPVLDVHELVSFVEREGIRVAILCVPEEAAPGIMEQVRRSHLRGVLNFTAAHLRSDAQCIVHNLDIRMEIEKLFCLVEMVARNSDNAAVAG